MAYVALRFDAAAAHADAWSDALLEAGALSVDLSDPGAGTDAETPLYGEPGEIPAIRVAVVARRRAVRRRRRSRRCARARRDRPSASRCRPSRRTTCRRRTGCGARRRSSGRSRSRREFWIVPTWSTPVDPDALTLRLDPGLAFGTGSHPTTRLCLEWLHAHDRRAASACSTTAAAPASSRSPRASWAPAPCLGTDVDPQAMRASEANARVNDVDARFVLPDALPPGTYDIVIANILANPLMLLAPALAARVRVGGASRCRAFSPSRSEDVAAAYARWFTLAPWRAHDGWVLLAGVRER